MIQTAQDVLALMPARPELRSLYEAMRDAEAERSKLEAHVEDLILVLRSVRSKLNRNQPVNPMGELQAHGPQFDLTCARYELAKLHASVLATAFGLEVSS